MNGVGALFNEMMISHKAKSAGTTSKNPGLYSTRDMTSLKSNSGIIIEMQFAICTSLLE